MSLIITTYVSEGIVMASDSRLTRTIITNSKTGSFSLIPFSDNVYKTFLTPNNYGISICGAASANNLPLVGYIDAFIKGFDYTKCKNIMDFSNKFMDMIKSLKMPGLFIAHIAGYDNDKTTYSRRIVRCISDNGKNTIEESAKSNTEHGAMWDGETEILSRLIKQQIISPNIMSYSDVICKNKSGAALTLKDAYVTLKKDSRMNEEAHIDWNLFSLQDAVDFSRFAIKTTIDTQRFISIAKTVGGPVDVLIIKPRQGIWLSHKELK